MNNESLITNYKKRVLFNLLEIKDSDIRISILKQGQKAIDKGVHIGGAFSSVIPLVSLYYTGILENDIRNPTNPNQDFFVLSKGHAVAAMASIYADLGYFPVEVLEGSRSYESILNGHPGPILPGVHTATGPLGQGIGFAEGLALAARYTNKKDVYVLVGDGELQEGIVWEAIMFSGTQGLENFCVLVDKNQGQLDTVDNLVFPMDWLGDAFCSFGWNVRSVNGTQYPPVVGALEEFKYSKRNGKPTVIICNTRKGFGGFSSFMRKHKVDLPDTVAEQEIKLQERRREERVRALESFLKWLPKEMFPEIFQFVQETAKRMHLSVSISESTLSTVPVPGPVILKKAEIRDKRISYSEELLPKLDQTKQYSAQEVVTAAMKVFAMDPRVVSIDADLSTTSGLQAGVGFVDQDRAINVGVAEANMMLIGEGFASLGYNTWVSTFCPFFDWKVLRRVAISHQERLEAIERKDGWLAEGHGLDLTFLATAPNLETRTNGATHMGNDDILVFDEIAHLKIIDASCPQQVLSIMKWIVQGNRGLVYVRILRAPASILYPPSFRFELHKGYPLKSVENPIGFIVSSGRGVYEALSASKILEQKGLQVEVIDMPSIDEDLLLNLYDTGKPIIFAEQNNGYLWKHAQIYFFKHKRSYRDNLISLNLLDSEGKKRFIHSATYPELLQYYGLSPEKIAERFLMVV